MNTVHPATIKDQLSQLEHGTGKPFSACQDLAGKVADLMESAPEEAAACLKLAAELYDHTGEGPLRIAIENCFLFHLGNRIFASADRDRLLALLPQNLHDALMHQMLSTGL